MVYQDKTFSFRIKHQAKKVFLKDVKRTVVCYNPVMSSLSLPAPNFLIT